MPSQIDNLSEKYIKLLSEIKDHSDLETLIPSKILRHFINSDMSLYDILLLSKNEFSQFNGIGKGKLEILNELQNDLIINQKKYTKYYQQNILKNINLSDYDYFLILNSLNTEKAFQDLVPTLIINDFMKSDMSLLDIMNISDNEVNSSTDFGRLKLDVLHDFQNELKNNREKFIRYNRSIGCHFNILPINYSSNQSIVESIYSCFNDYIRLYELSKKKTDNRNVELWKKYLGIGCEPQDLKEIYKNTGLTKERVRQIIKNKFELYKIFKGENSKSLKINSNLKSRIDQITINTVYTSNFIDTVSGDYTFTSKIYARIAELMSFQLVLIEDLGYFLVPENESRTFTEHFRVLKQNMNKDVTPISLYKILEISRENYNDTFCEDIILKIIKFSELYEEYEDESDENKYWIKWHHCSSKNTKIKRILYDNGDKMSFDEIFEEYNRRCMLYGQNQITKENFYFHGDDQLKTFGKSGYWQFYENEGDFENPEQAWVVIENFIISKNGIARFEDIKDELLRNNLVYSDTTIRAYTLKSCFISIDDSDLYIHVDYKYNYPNISVKKKQQKYIGNYFINAVVAILRDKGEMTRGDLLSTVTEKLKEEDYNLNKNNGYNYLKKFVRLGILFEKNIDGVISISIDEDELINYDLETLGKQKEPTYRSVIRSQAVQFLKEKETASHDELWELSKEYYPPKISKSNFYKIFDDTELFEKYTENNTRFVKLFKELLPEPKDYTEEVDVPNEILKEQVAEIISSIPSERYQVVRKIFQWNELKEQIIKELSQDYFMNSDEINSGLNAIYSVAFNNDEVTRWGRLLLQSIYDLWFTKTDYYDRDVCFQRLTVGYESFISKLTKVPDEIKGLAEIINYNPLLNDLRQYKFVYKDLSYYEVEKRKKEFSYKMSSLIYFRNLYSHNIDNDDLDLGFSKLIKHVTDFIALYVYTGYILTSSIEK